MPRTQNAEALKAAEEGDSYYFLQLLTDSAHVGPDLNIKVNEICADGFWKLHSVQQTTGGRWHTLVIFDRTSKAAKSKQMGFHS